MILTIPPQDYLIANQFAYSEPVPIAIELDMPPEASTSPVDAIKTLITKYSLEYGINSIVALNIARAESELNPLAKNKNSSASGLFQIIKGTYKHFKCGDFKDVFLPEENIKCAIKIMKTSGFHHWNASRDIWFELNKNS